MPVSEGEIGSIKWSPDGKSFLYSKFENGVANIWSAPIEGKATHKKVTNFQSDRIFAFDVSPDNRLVISRGAWATMYPHQEREIASGERSSTDC